MQIKTMRLLKDLAGKQAGSRRGRPSGMSDGPVSGSASRLLLTSLRLWEWSEGGWITDSWSKAYVLFSVFCLFINNTDHHRVDSR